MSGCAHAWRRIGQTARLRCLKCPAETAEADLHSLGLRCSFARQLTLDVTARLQVAETTPDREDRREALHHAIGAALDLLTELNKLALESRL